MTKREDTDIANVLERLRTEWRRERHQAWAVVGTLILGAIVAGIAGHNFLNGYLLGLLTAGLAAGLWHAFESK